MNHKTKFGLLSVVSLASLVGFIVMMCNFTKVLTAATATGGFIFGLIAVVALLEVVLFFNVSMGMQLKSAVAADAEAKKKAEEEAAKRAAAEKKRREEEERRRAEEEAARRAAEEAKRCEEEEAAERARREAEEAARSEEEERARMAAILAAAEEDDEKNLRKMKTITTPRKISPTRKRSSTPLRV